PGVARANDPLQESLSRPSSASRDRCFELPAQEVASVQRDQREKCCFARGVAKPPPEGFSPLCTRHDIGTSKALAARLIRELWSRRGKEPDETEPATAGS